jgi:hypothetical protein
MEGLRQAASVALWQAEAEHRIETEACTAIASHSSPSASKSALLQQLASMACEPGSNPFTVTTAEWDRVLLCAGLCRPC